MPVVSAAGIQRCVCKEASQQCSRAYSGGGSETSSGIWSAAARSACDSSARGAREPLLRSGACWRAVMPAMTASQRRGPKRRQESGPAGAARVLNIFP